MFEPTKNIDTAFRAMRVTMITVIAGCLIISGYAVYRNGEISERMQDRIYVLHSGMAMEAIASSRRDNLPVEAKDHVRRFHELFFALDPDEKAISSSIRRALYLADATAKKQYDDLVETGYIAGIISGNVSQQIVVDSVLVNTAVEPYAFHCYATMRITRSSSIVTRNLVSKGYLRSVARSDHNPHGFLIERWEVLENKDIKIENR